jgi:hypothetical protein
VYKHYASTGNSQLSAELIRFSRRLQSLGQMQMGAVRHRDLLRLESQAHQLGLQLAARETQSLYNNEVLRDVLMPIE